MQFEKLTWYTFYGCLVGGNSGVTDPLPSVDDIAAVTENMSEENAILIAETEIAYLDDLSLEGDIPDDLSLQE
jgi:hypothetical protein